MSTVHHRDGAVWEDIAGYARAARRGSWIAVSGTTASAPDGSALFPGDTRNQTRAALERALDAVRALGGSRADVVRSRILLVPGADWEAAAVAHADQLGDIAPANTMVFVSALVGAKHLVEVELDAVLVTGTDDRPAS